MDDDDYAHILRTWAGTLANRRDRLIYNQISAMYGVHDREFSHTIQKDTYDQIYGREYLEERANRMIELYKKLEESNAGRRT